MFRINLANKGGGLSIEIKEIDFPTICAPLPATIDTSEYPHLDGLELSDFDPCNSNSNNDSIDILVGADHYWDLVIGDIIHGRNGPTAVSSKLGWLLSGWSKQPQSDSSTLSNLILAGERLNNSSVTSDAMI